MALSPFRFMISSLKYFIDIILPAKSIAFGSNQPLRESSTSVSRKCKGGQAVALTTFEILCADCIEIRDPQSRGYS